MFPGLTQSQNTSFVSCFDFLHTFSFPVFPLFATTSTLSTMRLRRSLLFLLSTLAAKQAAQAFVPTGGKWVQHRATTISHAPRAFSTSSLRSTWFDAAQVSGEPSDFAKATDPRQAIREVTIYCISGEPTTMDELIGEPKRGTKSIVVLLRSLG